MKKTQIPGQFHFLSHFLRKTGTKTQFLKSTRLILSRICLGHVMMWREPTQYKVNQIPPFLLATHSPIQQQSAASDLILDPCKSLIAHDLGPCGVLSVEFFIEYSGNFSSPGTVMSSSPRRGTQSSRLYS